jgi:hypothetical protein
MSQGRRPLYHVRQRHSIGCGIAAVAMLSGESYERVLQEYRKLLPRDSSLRTESTHVRQLLARFGVRLGRKVRTRRWAVLKHRALAAINRTPDGYHWHWVVFEPAPPAATCSIRGRGVRVVNGATLGACDSRGIMPLRKSEQLKAT